MIAAHARNLFLFPESAAYLNHGGYGVTPAEVMEARVKNLHEIEANPTRFLAYEFSSAWQAAIARVAERFSVSKHDLTLVENITDGANAILRSFPFAAGDEIITTSLTYGSIHKAATYIARQHGAKVSQIELAFPDPDPGQYIEAVKRAITGRTRVAILDHITSSTALVLPIAEMTKVCRERGVAVLVDGAHAPGNIAFDVNAIGADWYVANLHKWYFVPRGCGFLWAAPHRHNGLMPNVLSWNIEKPFPHNFEWTGTRDPTPWLSIPAAFDFMDKFGEENVRRHNHALVRRGMALLADAWGVSVNAPDSMTGSMGLVPLPGGMPFAPGEDGRKQIEQELSKTHGITISPSFADQERIWLRVSAQIYNDIGDYERLARAVNGMRRRLES